VRFFFIGILVLLLSACLSEPDCTVTATNIVRITLKKAITRDSVIFVKFKSITVSGTESTFQNLAGDSVSTLQLPVKSANGHYYFSISV